MKEVDRIMIKVIRSLKEKGILPDDYPPKG